MNGVMRLRPWLVTGFIVNPFTGVASTFAVWQSKRAAKEKRSHKNRRAAK